MLQEKSCKKMVNSIYRSFLRVYFDEFRNNLRRKEEEANRSPEHHYESGFSGHPMNTTPLRPMNNTSVDSYNIPSNAPGTQSQMINHSRNMTKHISNAQNQSQMSSMGPQNISQNITPPPESSFQNESAGASRTPHETMQAQKATTSQESRLENKPTDFERDSEDSETIHPAEK
jgi:hypothetical protein